MTHQITLGENSKLSVRSSEREQVRRFYRDLLGCPQTKESDKIDIFQIGTTFFLGVVYDDAAPSSADRLNSIWLELNVDDPNVVKKEILAFGITEIEYWDNEHFYFQAPGGQVYRLAATSADMSKWQR